jgi:hypothetical protein
MHARDKSGAYAIIGSGTKSCGTFIEDKKSPADSIYRAWVAGYITALNMHIEGINNLMGSTDMNGLIVWLENYCMQNPLSNFETAVQALAAKLFATQQRR